MKKNQVFAITAVAIVIIAAVGVALMFMNDDGGDGDSDTTVTDSLGRVIEIPQSIDSIFCVGACSLRLVSYFEASDKVQAIETAGTFNTRNDQTYYLVNRDTFSALPQVATTAEAILELNPSVIITSTMTDAGTADNLQSQTGIPVYAINANLEFGEAFYGQITSLGTLFGEQERAAELNDGIASMIMEITTASTEVSAVSAYACGMFYYGGSSFLKASGDYLPFDYSNVTNAIGPATNGQPYVITLETLLAADPGYIFIDSIGLSGCIGAMNGYIDDDTGLANVSAIQNDRVFSTMVYKCYGTNWENQLINVYFVASKMNGELFSWTFEEKANDILQLFYPGTDVTYSDIVDGQTGSGCGKVTL
ncbi:MAG: ABC transporter substrate-binding protein [Methanomassiliicoccales archaeon]|nr:ABC transporter substrate-binding protein [Methanomassiliicoccales archaeon]